MRPRLRLYTGEDDDQAIAPAQVTMKLGEFLEILNDARRFDRTWLTDFANDDVQLSEDLYEVLTAYWRLRPGA